MKGHYRVVTTEISYDLKPRIASMFYDVDARLFTREGNLIIFIRDNKQVAAFNTLLLKSVEWIGDDT